MNCPYLDCNAKNIAQAQTHCPDCQGQLKRCGKCTVPNRAFSVFCRECGEQLPESDTNWPMHKGGLEQQSMVRRPSITRKVAELNVEILSESRLESWCKGLLIYDNYLFAVSQSGEIKISDISRSVVKEAASFNAGGNIYCIPAISQGTLYIGTKSESTQADPSGSIHAYSLGNLIDRQTAPCWTITVGGTPFNPLLPVNNRLFFTLGGYADPHTEIHVIHRIGNNSPSDSERIFTGSHLSQIAGNSGTGKIYFFSGDRDHNQLHCYDTSEQNPNLRTLPVNAPQSRVKKNCSVSVMGEKIFAVFENNENLCLLRTDGNFEGQLDDGIRDFVIEDIRNPIVIKDRGVFSRRINRLIVNFEGGQSVRGIPLIFRGSMIALPMNDGNIHLYDTQNPTFPKILRVSDNPAENITAMAGSKNIIVAGNNKGLVKIFRLS